MSQRTEKYKWCDCHRAKIRTDEIGRQYNSKLDGKDVCVECKVEAMYRDASKVHRTSGIPKTIDTDPTFL